MPLTARRTDGGFHLSLTGESGNTLDVDVDVRAQHGGPLVTFSGQGLRVSAKVATDSARMLGQALLDAVEDE